MRSRTVKTSRARRVALAVGAGVLSSLAFASASFASAPASGIACQSSDGKVNGRGATFQTLAQQNALIPGYTADVCGPVTSDADAGANMIAYNYASAVSNSLTGSGAGLNGSSCRTDAFSGSDQPYTEAQLTTLNTTVGGLTTCNTLPGGFTPPFQPTPGPWPDTVAGQTDQVTKVMSFPVAGASVALGANFAPTDCGGNPPSSLNLTAADVSGIFGGSITQWNDARLTADNPGLAACTGLAITRVVRLDSSGTTTTFKSYLRNADPSTTLCDGSSTWTSLFATNTTWATGGSCSPLVRGASNGGPALLAALLSTDGGIGYADFADWNANAPAIPLDNVAAADNSGFVSPGSFPASNCSFAGSLLPGSSNSDAVGLSTTGLNWANNAVPNRQDQTFRGNGYPICGFTWDLVYQGSHVLNGTQAGNPITRLSNDQRRTLYSYFTYVLSPAAQARLPQNGYSSLPATFLTKLRLGFQAGF